MFEMFSHSGRTIERAVRTHAICIALVGIGLLAVAACRRETTNPNPTATTYTISGAVTGATVAGVTISLAGTSTASTTTDGSGNYSFSGLASGSYTVAPTKIGYTFSPIAYPLSIDRASVPGVNFVATANAANTYSISGTVTGAAVAGVTISLTEQRRRPGPRPRTQTAITVSARS